MKKIVEYWDKEKTKIKFEFFLNENGKLDGVSKSYYENGNLKFEDNWKDGKLDGVSKSYYPNNNLEYKENYKDGKRHGLFTTHHGDGTLYEKRNYKDDKLTKLTKYFY